MPTPEKQGPEGLAEAARRARKRAGRGAGEPRRSRPADVFGSEIRRRDVLPLLVLHLIAREPAYGNRLIDEIERITDGVLSVNPNTIYPLLRSLEERGAIEGQWEHPDRRSRRFYSLTQAGQQELKLLRAEVEPFLDSVIRSVTLIKREIYETGEPSRLSGPDE